MEFEGEKVFEDEKKKEKGNEEVQEPAQTTNGSSSAKSVNWERAYSGKKTAIAWVGTCIAGVLAIFLIPDVRGVLFAVALLIIYAIVGSFGKKTEIEKFADSVYFLGFLWTMSALIHVLYTNIAANQVFYAFGYALTATAVGMFLRMVLLQAFVTVPDHLRDAQLDIDQRLQNFSYQVSQAAQDVENFRQTVLSEKLRELDSDLSRASEFFKGLTLENEKIKESFSKSSEAIGQVVNDFESLKAVFVHLKSSIEELNSQTKSFSSKEIPKLLEEFHATQNSISEAHGASKQLYNAVTEVLKFSRTHIDAAQSGKGGLS